MNGLCRSCSSYPAGSGKQQLNEHKCFGDGCLCATCNPVPVVLYSSRGLAMLQQPSKVLFLGGFGLLNIASALYSTFGVNPLIWAGLTAGSIFYFIRAARDFRHG